MSIIGIIGPNQTACSSQLYEFGVELGYSIARSGRIIVCGGRGGFMEAVCRGVKESPGSFFGQTIGILPSDSASQANAWVDVPIPTGMGSARNLILVNTAQIIIAAGGGAGTLSELALAWQQNKKVLCLTSFGGWAAHLAGKEIDERRNGLLIPVQNLAQILGHLD